MIVHSGCTNGGIKWFIMKNKIYEKMIKYIFFGNMKMKKLRINDYYYYTLLLNELTNELLQI